MNSKEFQAKVRNNFNEITKENPSVFSLGLEKNELWEIYLNSFPKGTNEIYRERREYDCSCCRQFINNIGDKVIIKDNKIITLWDFEIEDETYTPVVKALRNHLKNKPIKDMYMSKFKKIGTKENYEDDNGSIITYNHFNIELPSKYVTSNSIATITGDMRALKDVFKRSLEEIKQESVLTILELISQNSLYKGEEWKTILTNFHLHQTHYTQLQEKEKDIWLWDKATLVGNVIGKIRNHSIGTLLTSVSEGEELDVAVRKYESMVAPTNYKRPKPIFTKAMLEKAKKKIDDLGYGDSLQRRYALLEDIKINNVLYANRDVISKLQTNDVFAELEQDVVVNPKTFNKLEEVPIKDFIEKVLPTAKKIEVYLENKQSRNMVSLIAPFKSDSKTMFKWNNNFSWAYTGNITDSDIKKNVKSAGGKVDGVLRFSMQWNDLGKHNPDDYDAHCKEPKGNLIYFSSKVNHNTRGRLDVDITNPRKGVSAVENITWSDINKMEKGKYKFLVNNFSHRGGSDGFQAEIEFNGEIHKFEYRKPLNQGQRIEVADVEFNGLNFKIINKLPSETSASEVWNLKTNNFVPISTIMYSPNYWDEQKGIGNKHYFFMLKDCISDEIPNGFFNEFLNNELNEHRKVFEVLGSKMKVTETDNQLSGLGFSSTQRNDLILRVEGQTKRIIKIKI